MNSNTDVVDHQEVMPHNDDDGTRYSQILRGKCRVEKPLRTSNDFIADAMNQLSVEGRERIYNEIHGVEEVREETAEILEKGLADVKTCLSKLTSWQSTQSEGFRQAERQSQEFVYKPSFLRQFLRADRFNAEDAATRIVKYFNLKLQCFGKDMLCKDIAYSDLYPEDKEALAKGTCQILPERDRSGRAIFFASPLPDHEEDSTSIESFCRIRMYQVPNDTESQSCGMVCIVYGNIDKENPSMVVERSSLNEPKPPSCLPALHKIREALPIRINAIHFCFQDRNHRRQNNLLDSFLNIADTDTRCRTKVHYGTTSECNYILLTFGIPIQIFPIDRTRKKLKLKNHGEWIQMRKKREEMQAAGRINEKDKDSIIDIPSQSDFLVGRGVPFQGHAGNMELHSIIDEYMPRFKAASKTEKLLIVNEILNSFKARKGRFLSQETGVWRELADETAKEKVSQLFRSRRKLTPDSSVITSTSSMSDFAESSWPTHHSDYGAEGAANAEITIVDKPSKEDFLVGRGQLIKGHPGNMRLHTIIDNNLACFDKATKTQKTVICSEIMGMFKAEGGRFLNRESGNWTEVPDEIAREKISQMFRSRRKLREHPHSHYK